MIKGIKEELLNNILPYWMNKMPDQENGGFYGRIDGQNNLHKQANKGAVLNTRILWTFSSAYRIFKQPEYLAIAKRAFDYINTYFIDKKYGGVYWELDYQGNPVNPKKQSYAQGFALYGFSEYYRATGDILALERAKELFLLIEKHILDKDKGGYFEAFTEDWNLIEDMRLSAKDVNEKKTMNTHLHILEPYSNLFRVWKDKSLEDSLRNLINIFTDKILNNNTYHLNLFFDEDWNNKSEIISYGHDIEASWLLFEAAEAIGDKELLEKLKVISLKIVDSSMEGLQPDGSLIYEKENQHLDTDKHWWVQAENVVGLLYAYKNSGNKVYFENASKCWNFIQDQIIDKTNGEWVWSRKLDGFINTAEDKAGFWKCPYHNARMCMEALSVLANSYTE